MLEKLHTVALNLFTELFSSRDDATGLRSVLSLLRQREYFRSLSKLNTDYALMPHRGSDGCPCVCIISARARPVFVLGSKIPPTPTQSPIISAVLCVKGVEFDISVETVRQHLCF